MKKIVYFLFVFALAGSYTSCKSKKTETPETTTTTTTTTIDTTAPVQINSDDELTRGVEDATKDFPGVKATVANGEVTLTGTIKRDRLPTLMESIQGLHPKKVNNNLTIE
jgi:hypothetical protein